MQKLKDIEKKVLEKRENLNDILKIFEIYEKTKSMDVFASLFRVFSKYVNDFNHS